MERKEIHKEEIDNLISMYLTGNIDTQSLKTLVAWSKESSEKSLYVRNKIEIWFSSGVAGSMTPFDKEKAFERFKNRIEKATIAEEQKQRFTKSRSLKIFYRVAAAILIILLPLAGYWGGMETVKSGFSDIVVEAPMGARTKLYLPDGTLVWLNAGSKITYSQGFGVDNRDLTLEGEGYFEVKRNEEVPFKVNTEDLNLRVLGTVFNFRNYIEDDEAVVELIEGCVELNRNSIENDRYVMSPSDKYIMNKKDGSYRLLRSKPDNARAWTNGELFFDNDCLSEIARILERTYNVDIVVADSLKNLRFYASFVSSEMNVEEILKSFAATERMKYEIKNNRYLLY